jgi:hypothetical protein
MGTGRVPPRGLSSLSSSKRRSSAKAIGTKFGARIKLRGKNIYRYTFNSKKKKKKAQIIVELRRIAHAKIICSRHVLGSSCMVGNRGGSSQSLSDASEPANMSRQL